MNIGSISSNPLLSLVSRQSGGQNAQAAPSIGAVLPANSAAARSILPSPNSATQLSFETLLSLQQLDDPQATLPAPATPTQLFLKEAQKSPMERMREQVLDQLGLTEEALTQMSPEQRRAAEDQIREMIEEKIRQAMGADDEAPGSNAEMLQGLMGA